MNLIEDWSRSNTLCSSDKTSARSLPATGRDLRSSRRPLAAVCRPLAVIFDPHAGPWQPLPFILTPASARSLPATGAPLLARVSTVCLLKYNRVFPGREIWHLGQAATRSRICLLTVMLFYHCACCRISTIRKRNLTHESVKRNSDTESGSNTSPRAATKERC